MPLFEFKCRQCGRQFETFQFSATRSLPPCPACDATDVEKLYSTFGVAGSGASGRDSAPRPTFSGG